MEERRKACMSKSRRERTTHLRIEERLLPKCIITLLSITMFQWESDFEFQSGAFCSTHTQKKKNALSSLTHARTQAHSLAGNQYSLRHPRKNTATALNLRRESSRWVCECFEKRPLNSSSSAHAHARDSSTCLPLWLRKGSAQPAHPQSP